MGEAVPGWTAPIEQGLAEPVLWGGVPPMVLVTNVMVTLLWTLFWWRAPFVGLTVHLVVQRCCAWEVQWFGMLRAYWGYATHYEG